MTRLARLAAATAVAALGIALVACGSKSDKPAASATFAPAGAATTTPAASATREVELVKSVRPRIDRMTEALKKNDLAAAKQAYEAYDAGWNGIEVYVNFRSRELYSALEQDLQKKIADGLDAKDSRVSDLVPVSEALARKYDEAIALSQKGPALHPLFDDLATLRIVRADLRIASAAINGGDLPKARAAFDTFKGNYPRSQPLIKVRSVAAESEVSDALSKAGAGFQEANASTDSVKPLVATLTARYNFGVNLLNAAARNAAVGRTTYGESDTQALTSLNDVVLSLRRSIAAWDAGTYPVAGQQALTASGAQFEKVKPALAAKSADATLKTALDAYASMSAVAGDAAKVRASNKAALEAVAIAQQVLVGQFWTEPRLQSLLAGLPQQ